MATSLAAQLSQLVADRGQPAKKPTKGKPSLLFDVQKAADVDVASLHQLALQGGHR